MVCLAAVLALTGCTQTNEDLIVGEWTMDRVTLTVMENGHTSVSELPGYDDYKMDFVKEGYCNVVVRGVATVYTWYLVDDNTLLLSLDGKAEDYIIDELTKKRLVYSDTYSVRDSVTNVSDFYTHTFELSKHK